MDPIAGETRPAAVALAQGSFDRDDVARLDRRGSERLGTDDRPHDARAVVDVDAEAIGERVRATDDGASDGDASPFVRLGRLARLDRDGSRDRAALAERDVGLGDPEDPLVIPGAERARHEDGRARRVAPTHRGIEIEADPSALVLDERGSARLQRAERRRQDPRDRDDRVIGQCPGLRDRHRNGCGVGSGSESGSGDRSRRHDRGRRGRRGDGAGSGSGWASGSGAGRRRRDSGRRASGVGAAPDGTGGADIACGDGLAWTIQSATFTFVSVVLPAEPPGSRSRLEPAAGAGAGAPSTNALVASPHPTASITSPPTTRRAIAPPVAANPLEYVRSAPGANRPAAFAMSTRRPGWSEVGARPGRLPRDGRSRMTSRRRPRGRRDRPWTRPGWRSRRTRPRPMPRLSGPRRPRGRDRPGDIGRRTGAGPDPGPEWDQDQDEDESDESRAAGRDPWLTSRRDTGRRVVSRPVVAVALIDGSSGLHIRSSGAHPVRCRSRPSRVDRQSAPARGQDRRDRGPRQEDRSRRSAPPPSSRDRRGGRDHRSRGRRAVVRPPVPQPARPPSPRCPPRPDGSRWARPSARRSIPSTCARTSPRCPGWSPTPTALWVPILITVVGGIAVARHQRLGARSPISCSTTSSGRRPSVACSSPASSRRGRAGCWPDRRLRLGGLVNALLVTFVPLAIFSTAPDPAQAQRVHRVRVPAVAGLRCAVRVGRGLVSPVPAALEPEPRPARRGEEGQTTASRARPARIRRPALAADGRGGINARSTSAEPPHPRMAELADAGGPSGPAGLGGHLGERPDRRGRPR